MTRKKGRHFDVMTVVTDGSFLASLICLAAEIESLRDHLNIRKDHARKSQSVCEQWKERMLQVGASLMEKKIWLYGGSMVQTKHTYIDQRWTESMELAGRQHDESCRETIMIQEGHKSRYTTYEE